MITYGAKKFLAKMSISSNAIQTYNLEEKFDNDKIKVRQAKFYSGSVFFVGYMEIFGS